ncbi:MAG: hypothetical protein IJZ26_00815 [Clostridia bacterium]|nr:hypothetical protein [Clostridia bacterium]
MPNYEFRKAMNAMGFFATVLIAGVILIAKVVYWIQTGSFLAPVPGLTLGSVVEVLMFVANICAYIIAIITGFAYAKSRRSAVYIIIQSLAVFVIVFVIISNLF